LHPEAQSPDNIQMKVSPHVETRYVRYLG